jgi:thioredoxin reductase
MTQDASHEAKDAIIAKQAAAAVPAPAESPVAAPIETFAESKLGVPGEDLVKVSYHLDDAGKYVDNDILVVGGGDTAIHAAIALSHGARNRVTLSYRGDKFHRGPERNRHLVETAEQEKRVRILKHCSVAAITPDSVILDVNGAPAEIPNDRVFILIDSEESVEFQPPSPESLRPVAPLR